MFWNRSKSAQNDINLLRSIQKLEIKEGDIIVLRHPYRLSEEAAKNLRSVIEEIIRSGGFNIKVMVLEDGMNIDGILSKSTKKKNNDKDRKNEL